MMIEEIDLSQIAEVGAASDLVGYSPERGVVDAHLSLEIVPTYALEDKSYVITLHAFASDGSLLDAGSSSWPVSAKLNAPYQYLPRIEAGPFRVNPRSFEAGADIYSLLVALRPWKSEPTENPTKFGACFAGSTAIIGGTPFLFYQRLGTLRQGHD